jgi:hypothetical protein
MQDRLETEKKNILQEKEVRSWQDSQQELSRLMQDRLETEKKNILQEKEVRSWGWWRGDRAPAGQAGDREEECPAGEGGKELGLVEG